MIIGKGIYNESVLAERCLNIYGLGLSDLEWLKETSEMRQVEARLDYRESRCIDIRGAAQP